MSIKEIKDMLYSPKEVKIGKKLSLVVLTTVVNTVKQRSNVL